MLRPPGALSQAQRAITLYYAQYPYTGAASIRNADMGSQTSLSATLREGAAFYVAAKAYDATGSSNYSNIENLTTTTNPPGISLSCVGVAHGTGESHIHVCVNLTNVPGTDWEKLTAHIGSTQPDGYSYTYNSDEQTYLTKACATLRITSYGAYSGVVGIATSGGTAALDWDINVTSTPVACQ